MANKSIMEQKQQKVSELTDKVEKASSVVIVDYRGITVEQDTALRAELRKSNVEYSVIKNRLMSRAFEKAGHNSFKDILEGPSSFAFAKGDPTVAVRVINDFTKKTKIKVKGGLVEGKPLDAAGMTAVASIPGKTVLVGQLLGMLTSPARSLAVVLSEIAKKKA